MVLALVLLPALAGVLGRTRPMTRRRAAACWPTHRLDAACKVGAVRRGDAGGRPPGDSVVAASASPAPARASCSRWRVLAIALGVAFGSAMLFGVSFALGAFFAGMLLNESELSHKAANDSLPLRDAFAVLFFVSVGMLFDPTILIEQPWQVLATVRDHRGRQVARRVRDRARVRPPDSHRADHLGQPGADRRVLLHPRRPRRDAADPAADRPRPGPGRRAALDHAQPAAVRPARPLAARSTRRPPPPTVETALPPGPSLDLHDHAIVIGYGRVGSALAQRAARPRRAAGGHRRRQGPRRRGARGRPPGDPRQRRVRHGAGRSRSPTARRSPCWRSRSALEAGETIAKLRAINPALTLLARAHSDAEVKHLLEHGADGAVMAERELAYSLAEMVMATPPYRTDGQAASQQDSTVAALQRYRVCPYAPARRCPRGGWPRARLPDRPGSGSTAAHRAVRARCRAATGAAVRRWPLPDPA